MNSANIKSGTTFVRSAFTLIELLVVIAIIGVLVALLLPAVQQARESGRRTQCSNHLKQMGLAFQNHHDAYRHLPTGGWGWDWVGDPDDGVDERQRGGWTYNILPFMEQSALYEIGKGQTGPLKQAELERLVGSPISYFNCPSRRMAKLYPIYIKPKNAPGITKGARTDYAVNAGSQVANERNGGEDPATLTTLPNPESYSGICFVYSKVTFAQITDGLSNTFMVGEKYLSVDQYNTGNDPADNENLYVGFDNDLYRTTYVSPPTPQKPRPRPMPIRDAHTRTIQDVYGVNYLHTYGSAHGAGHNALFCDGSVRNIAYSISEQPFVLYGSKADGEPISGNN